MTTYIALLRGINVGGQKKILMKDLKILFESLKFKSVTTYIQSGNVIFNTSEKVSTTTIAIQIKKAIAQTYDFDVPTLVLKATELSAIFLDCPFDSDKKQQSYFTLLHDKPALKYVEEVAQIAYPNEEFISTDACVYFYCTTGYGRAKMNTIFFEKRLKVTATTRNYKTMMKLAEMVKVIT